MRRGAFETRLGLLACAVLLLASAVAPRTRAQEDVIDEAVRVEITSLTPEQRVQGLVTIAGFAVDPRAPRAGEGLAAAPFCRGPQQPGGLCLSGLNERDVRVYLNDTSDERNLLGFARMGADSPAAVAAVGPRFDKVGFELEWQTCTFPPGRYTLWVFVSSLVQRGARNYTTLDVEVEPCAPASALDSDEFPAQPDAVFTLRLDQPVVRGEWRDAIMANFAAGVDARCPQPLASCRYGLQFRELLGPGESRTGSTTNSAYRFLVDPNEGTYYLGYLPPGDAPILTLIPWTPAPALARGTAPNRLAVIAQDNWLRLFVNGQQVGEAHDSRRPWGQVGWIAESDARGRGVLAQFDNFAATTAGEPAELSRVLGPPNAASFPPSRAGVQDDFRDPNSGWPIRSPDPATMQLGYVEGEYQVVKQSGPRRWAGAWLRGWLRDFEAEVDARLLPPTAGGTLHFGFRLQDNEDHYSFMVDPNAGTFSLGRLSGGQMTLLLDRRQSAAIERDTARNRLGVRARGDEFVLLVNGQEVGRARDDRYQGGGLIIGVASRDDARVEGRFGNLRVSPLD